MPTGPSDHLRERWGDRLRSKIAGRVVINDFFPPRGSGLDSGEKDFHNQLLDNIHLPKEARVIPVIVVQDECHLGAKYCQNTMP